MAATRTLCQFSALVVHGVLSYDNTDTTYSLTMAGGISAVDSGYDSVNTTAETTKL